MAPKKESMYSQSKNTQFKTLLLQKAG
jgi:hypothetical protein